MMPLPAETAAIMPLHESKRELTDTPGVLQALLEQPQSIKALAEQIRAQPVNQLILVGSGDSFSVAQIAAVYLEQQSHIVCRAWQTYQFLMQPPATLDHRTFVILISASGRPSAILDALHYAVALPCQVVGITNQPGNPFQELSDYCLFTGARKKGIPTQSSSAALLLLYQLAELLQPAKEDLPSRLPMMLEGLPVTIEQSARGCNKLDASLFFSKQVVLLGGGITAGVATLGSNLLACGPQLSSNCFVIEEYHHSLRLYQPLSESFFILFPDQRWSESLWHNTCDQLLCKGAQVMVMDPREMPSDIYHPNLSVIRHDDSCELGIEHSLFYSMVWLYELSVQLGLYFVQHGHQRAKLDSIKE